MYYQNPNSQYMGAYVTGQPQPQQDIAWTNPLTNEESKMLKEKDPDLVLVATDKELAQAKCTHRDPSKRCMTLRPHNGGVKCDLCGAEFNIIDLPISEIEKIVYGVIDIIQTSKLMYVNLPPATVADYFSMIPFLEKLPKLYETAQSVFRKANGNIGVDQYQYSANPWDVLQNAVSNPSYGMPMGYGYGAPQMNQMYAQQPVGGYYQQPVQQPQGFYADPGFNPLQQAPQGMNPQYFNGQGFMNRPAQTNPYQAQQPMAAPNTVVDQAPAPVENKPAEGEVVTTNKQFSL